MAQGCSKVERVVPVRLQFGLEVLAAGGRPALEVLAVFVVTATAVELAVVQVPPLQPMSKTALLETPSSFSCAVQALH
jgi:hypothetical protein